MSLNLDGAKQALFNVASAHLRGVAERVTGQDATDLAALSELEIRYGILAATGDPQAEELRLDVEALIVGLAARVVVREGRELEKTLRDILRIGRDVLVEALKIAGQIALS